jgi:hypothetical protein
MYSSRKACLTQQSYFKTHVDNMLKKAVEAYHGLYRTVMEFKR